MNRTPIPFLDLIENHRALEEELVLVLRESLRSAAFIGGAQVEAFEQEFADYCGTTTVSASPAVPMRCDSLSWHAGVVRATPW